MSDSHRFSPVYSTVYPSNWLLDGGVLIVKETISMSSLISDALNSPDVKASTSSEDGDLHPYHVHRGIDIHGDMIVLLWRPWAFVDVHS